MAGYFHFGGPMDRWSTLQRLIEHRRSRGRLRAAQAGAVFADEAKACKKVHQTVEQVLAFIEAEDSAMRAAITGASISGRALALEVADSAALFMLDRWVRMRRHEIISACASPPSRVYVRVGAQA